MLIETQEVMVIIQIALMVHQNKAEALRGPNYIKYLHLNLCLF